MGKTTAPSADTDSSPAIRPELLRLLELLPPDKQREVLDFARFLHEQMPVPEAAREVAYPGAVLHAAPAGTLSALTGLVALDGDAVADTEALYDDNAGQH